jgi:ubiquinone/menaquinone biosynthesis C-methylase UbiE
MDDKDFIDSFACPLCHVKLVHNDKYSYLKCPQCTHKFPIIDGIVDAFISIEGLKLAGTELADRYEYWGEFVTRSEDAKQRRDITVSLVEGNLVLEIGCAEGFMTSELIRKVPSIIASDISFNYLQRAKTKVPCARFTRLDIHNIPFGDNTFDCVVCTEVLEHTLSPFRALNEMHRVLKPNGSLVISVPNGMTFSRIILHMFRKKNSLISFTNAHLNFYDTGSLLQILEVSGFISEAVIADKVPFPGLWRLGGRLAAKCFPFFGKTITVRATKKEIDYWEKLGTMVELRKLK